MTTTSSTPSSPQPSDSNRVSLDTWGIVVLGNEKTYPRSHLHKLVRGLVLASSCAATAAVTTETIKITIPNKTPPFVFYKNPHGNLQKNLVHAWIMTRIAAKHRPQLLVIVLPCASVCLYDECKRVAETVLGVPAQFVMMSQARDSTPEFFASVCREMSWKLRLFESGGGALGSQYPFG
ncbi:hypothetical protein BGX29_003204 [Mortierella sp. GBA35]|nr:hypothetical protein BGX29_003204 [Mortierella sp. GBA35]